MTDEVPSQDDPLMLGEKFTAEWQFRYLVLGEVPADTKQLQALYDSTVGREVAELSTIRRDILFAHECFQEADKMGLPDSASLLSRALINAAVISYGRVFKGGVRTARVDMQQIIASLPDTVPTHDFLLSLRDKHIAHSVNEFERAVAGPLMVQPPQGAWSPRGVGSIVQVSVGINRRTVLAAISLTKALLDNLESRIQDLEEIAFHEFVLTFEKTGHFIPAPLLTVVDRGKIGDRRPKST